MAETHAFLSSNRVACFTRGFAIPTDGMQEENNVISSLQTKRATNVSQLHLNFKLHNILMPSDMKSDYSDHSEVGIFSRIHVETS